ncbi:MAG: hypothetical protein COV99_03090 [Bacteroidetes bacterium CG12_big_fil_rev_8_21_14_0_65_60_17]|nr:MAG: hypothetical protein COV99_03090 [Bacteroidetes bacterium CG12_big_fil_rev_8_21_14_0_65_60_17]
MTPVDEQLISRAQSGDAEAFSALLSHSDARVVQIVHGITGNMPDALDVFQTAVLKAWRGMHAFRADSSFDTWLTRIAINEALSHRKKATRLRAVPLDEEHIGELESSNDAPDSGLLREDSRRHLEAAMAALSDRERTVFTLKHVHEYKIREIAHMLDCAEGTVKNYLFRAVHKLRNALS